MSVKTIFFLILSLTTLSCNRYYPTSTKTAVEIKIPFRVVYHESTYLASGIPVTKHEPLEWTDSITLKNGFVILAHYSGNLKEISGDTVISINKLSKSISADSTKNAMIDISFLYSTSSYHPDYYRNSVVEHPPHITWVFPYLTKEPNKVGDSSLCLWWRSAYPKNHTEIEYTLRISDVFNKELHTSNILGNRATIDLSKIFKSNKFVVIGLHESSDKNRKARFLGIQLVDETILDPCQANSSIKYLQLGIVLERNRDFNEAMDYFKLAAENSDRPIYSKLLGYFKERHVTL